MKCIIDPAYFRLHLYFILLLVLQLGGFHTLGAQTLCFETPTTAAEMATCNSEIARTFAPVLLQAVSLDTEQGLDGIADRIVGADFDGDWNTLNNWENAEMANSLTSAMPKAYYHVIWTENFWIVTYTFYWARDYGSDDFIFGDCSKDHHEGDADKVLVIVRRPSSADTDAADLSMGVIVSRHGDEHGQTCVDDLSAVTDSDPFIGGGRTHTFVGSAAGSHAIFTDHLEMIPKEPGINPCIPTAEAGIIYLPGSSATKGPLPTFATTTTERYTLEDATIPGGLWDRRFIFQTFPEWAEFGCNNFCDGPGLASAPWNGARGSDPIDLLDDFFKIFSLRFPFFVSCECRDEICDGGNDLDFFTDTEYEYNPYLCEELNPFAVFGTSGTMCEGEERLFTVDTDSPVSWDIPPGLFVLPSAPGDPPNSIRVKVADNAVNGVYQIYVSEDAAPCFARVNTQIEIGAYDDFNPYVDVDVLFCNFEYMQARFKLGNTNFPAGATFEWNVINGSPTTGTGTSIIASNFNGGPIFVQLIVTLPCGGKVKYASGEATPDDCDGFPKLLRVSPNPTSNEVCIYLGDVISKTPNLAPNVNFSTLSAVPISELDPALNEMDVYLIKDASIKVQVKMDQTLQCINIGHLEDGLYQVITQHKGKTVQANLVKIDN